MTRGSTTVIRFDGPALRGHSMDVAELAPSLLALSELVKIANRYANGDRAGVRVLVNADLEQHCFQLNVELALTIWEQAKLFLADERVKNAKELAEILGIVYGSSVGLFQLIKKLRGKKVTNVTIVKLEDGKNVVEVRVEGETEVTVIEQQVYDLYANLDARRRAVEVFRPLRVDGYDSLEFKEADNVIFRAGKEDAPEADMSDLPEVIPQNEIRSTIRTRVRIRKAAYEGVSKWTLMYKKAIEAPIDDESWRDAFQAAKIFAPPGSSLDVDLEELYITNDWGEVVGEPTYRVLKIYDVVSPSIQTRMEFRDDSK